jgi:hypothetical protein
MQDLPIGCFDELPTGRKCLAQAHPYGETKVDNQGPAGTIGVRTGIIFIGFSAAQGE